MLVKETKNSKIISLSLKGTYERKCKANWRTIFRIKWQKWKQKLDLKLNPNDRYYIDEDGYGRSLWSFFSIPSTYYKINAKKIRIIRINKKIKCPKMNIPNGVESIHKAIMIKSWG